MKIDDLPVLTREGLRPEMPYHFYTYDPFFGTGRVHEGFLWSPDGRGCYFYDTREELEEQHGDEPRPRVVKLHPDFF